MLGLAAAAGLAIALVVAPQAGAATTSAAAPAAVSAAVSTGSIDSGTVTAVVVSHTGLVRFQSGGCLTASRLAFRAVVVTEVCHPGWQRDTWQVRTTGGHAQVCIVRTFECLDHIGGTAELLSVYAVGAWIQYHQYGIYVGLLEGQLNLTSNGYGHSASWWGGFTANAGRQLVRLPT